MSDYPQKVLITGVTGQDGSYMADYLLANTNHKVFGMIRRTAKPDYSNLAGALTHPDRFKLVVGDLSDGNSIDALVREIRPDFLVNLAAQSFVGSSWAIPEQTLDVSGTGVLRCLEAIRKHAADCKIYSAGSSEQFGDILYAPQDENHPMRPRSPYGCAKCLAAHLVKVYRESYGLYAVHGTLFNHESPRRGEEFVTRKITLGVARIAHALRRGSTFEPLLLGNLDARRDWSHAMDFVDGIWRILNQDVFRALYDDFVSVPGFPEETDTKWQSARIREYVLASGETHTVREFVQRAFAVAGIWGEWRSQRDASVLPEEDAYLYGEKVLVRINPAFYRPAEVSLLLGNAQRAKDELGWQPKITFDQLVECMVVNDLTAYEQKMVA